MAIPIIGDIAQGVASIATSLVRPILDKIVGDKMSDADKALFEIDFQKEMARAAQDERDSFYEFVIQHSGAAKDMPRFVQVLRGTVRPVITYLVVIFDGWVIWRWMTFPSALESDAFSLMLKLLMAATVLVLGFWFGERLLTRSGIVQALMGRKNDA